MEIGRYSSPLGEITLAAQDGALIGLWFFGQKYDRAGLEKLPLEARPDDRAVLEAACLWLDGYFAGEEAEPAFPLAPQGTAFQQRVWERLRAIPYGETVSYGDLARSLGSSARAVGAAVGRNPISVLIPCHRVLSSDGSLTGYAGGLERKKALLELERNRSLS